MLCYNLHAGMDRCSAAWLSTISVEALSVCCPFPLGISIYGVESLDAGELVDSQNRQQTCGFDANRMKRGRSSVG